MKLGGRDSVNSNLLEDTLKILKVNFKAGFGISITATRNLTETRSTDSAQRDYSLGGVSSWSSCIANPASVVLEASQ